VIATLPRLAVDTLLVVARNVVIAAVVVFVVVTFKVLMTTSAGDPATKNLHLSVVSSHESCALPLTLTTRRNPSPSVDAPNLRT
jgi:hypothetical protein